MTFMEVMNFLSDDNIVVRRKSWKDELMSLSVDKDGYINFLRIRVNECAPLFNNLKHEDVMANDWEYLKFEG